MSQCWFVIQTACAKGIISIHRITVKCLPPCGRDSNDTNCWCDCGHLICCLLYCQYLLVVVHKTAKYIVYLVSNWIYLYFMDFLNEAWLRHNTCLYVEALHWFSSRQGDGRNHKFICILHVRHLSLVYKWSFKCWCHWSLSNASFHISKLTSERRWKEKGRKWNNIMVVRS